MVAPAVIAAGISTFGSLLGGRSANRAARRAQQAQEAAAARQEAMTREFDARTQKQTEPYRQFGEGSTNKLSDYLGIDSNNPEYGRAQSDYDNAQAEYSRLLQAPQQPVSGNIDKRYAQDYGLNGLFARQANTQNVATNSNNSELIAAAKSRLDASRAKLDGTARSSGRSSNFGSLLKPFSAQDLKNDVVYNTGLDFGREQGERGINNRALATGNFDSGAALKELTRYGNDYGNQRAGDAQQRFMGDKSFTFNSLMGGTQVGQNAVNTASGNSTTALNSINSAIAGGGNARSAGAIARGNVNGDMWGDIGGTLGSLLANRGGGGNASPGIQLRRV